MNDRIHVLDSTAFYAGIPFQGEGKYYTTYQVLDEVRGRGGVGAQLIHSRVQVTEPSKESTQKVKGASSRTGDSKSLSEADISILAVTLDLQMANGNAVVLVTDDFAVRNVAEMIGINLSETSIRGGGRTITWITYCKGCGKTYPLEHKGTICDVCGTKLSRKPKSTPSPNGMNNGMTHSTRIS